MELRVLTDRLSVCRLSPDSPWPTPSAGSTYHTEYILVHAAALERAIEVLRAAEHAVHVA